MNTTSLLAAITLAAVVLTATSPDAQARDRTRSVDRSAQGGHVAASRSNAKFDSQRQRDWKADGQGNVAGSSSGSIAGASGGGAARQSSAYRNADGSAGRQGSASVSGPNGGSAATSGSIARSADGSVAGSRTTSATGANGNGYNGSTTVSNGNVTHSGTCTNAAGETIACRGDR